VNTPRRTRPKPTNGPTSMAAAAVLSSPADGPAQTSTGVPLWLRASELPAYYPVFGATTWRKLIGSGELASRKIGAARIVRSADVELFLAGTDGAAMVPA
jgi:hypothetical protein